MLTPSLTFELVLGLVAVAVALKSLANWLQLPPAIAFILGGAGIALVPGIPQFEIDPALTMVLFLPPLLLSSAYFTTWRDFRADLRVILQLSVGAVFFTTLTVGWVTHLMLPSLPLAACFALGAIVSPPDAVAAKAVLRGLRLPARVIVLLEGESLVNDASGLVIYRFAVAACLTGTFNAGAATVTFFVLVIGGILAGLAIGCAVNMILARVRDVQITVAVTLLAAWGAYIIGDVLHVSGVLATVACGLMMGWQQHRVLSAAQRTQARAVWSLAEFIFESLVFILIGLSLRSVALRMGGNMHAFLAFLPAISAVVGTVILARFAWILPTTYLVRALLPQVRRRDPYPALGVPVMMSWAGMRGVVSLAAALALPNAFPGRGFIVIATFAVILVTVLVQGTTLGWLVRVLHVGDFTIGQKNTISEPMARSRLAIAQSKAITARSVLADGTHLHPRLVEQYNFRADAAVRYIAAKGMLDVDRQAHFAAILSTVDAGRAELLRLHRAGVIHDSVLHTLEADLDLEEMMARRVVSPENKEA